MIIFYKPTILLLLAWTSIFAILIAGCIGPDMIPEEFGPPPADQGTPTSPGTRAPDTISDNQTVTEANNQFAIELYTQLAESEDGNIFFSPYSISTALAITYEGARGNTAQEIRSVFHFPENTTLMRQGFAGIIAAINNRSSAYTLRTTNALWAENTFPFLPEYISTAEQVYGAKTTNLDFVTSPEESRLIINRWVEEQTGDKIKDLLPTGSIDPLTRLVITNAIYFKGTWVKQFDENKTTEEDFRTGKGAMVRVDMMQRTDEDAVYGYLETDTLQVLEMPYESDGGQQLSMLVLLPKGEDPGTIERSLDARKLSDLRLNLTSRRVHVYFPKFTLETKYTLKPTLSAMGMPTAFTPVAADFSGMRGSKTDLYIDNIFHQAFVNVNEEGTEAAAATGVVVGVISAPPPLPTFRADHPFIFVILDDETGTILFMGRVMNPAA